MTSANYRLTRAAALTLAGSIESSFAESNGEEWVSELSFERLGGGRVVMMFDCGVPIECDDTGGREIVGE